jgi:two-component system, OmpR family, response regulator VanR
VNLLKTILIVDDEPDVLEVVEMLLISEKYRVLKATNGIEALEVVSEETPDLVILDIMMPEMDGVETCKNMRKMDTMRNKPIVMFSAKLSAIDKKESFDAGADGFITKPFNARGFIAGIKTYLELSGI